MAFLSAPGPSRQATAVGPSLRLVAFLLLVLPLWGPCPAAAELGEYEVKAGYLFNFAKFVRWPGEAQLEVFRLCVMGHDPFGPVLEQVGGKTVRGRPVRIRRVDEPGEARTCHILFIGGREAARTQILLEKLGNRPVLTVGESEGFAERGGVVNLYREGRHIRFAINVDAAERAGLQVSSQLLGLARIVRDVQQDGRLESRQYARLAQRAWR